MRNIEVKFRTDMVLSELRNAASKGVRQIALDLVNEVQLHIDINNQVDTGAMKASVFMDASGTQHRTRGESIGDAAWMASQPGVKTGRTFNFADHVEPDQLWQPKGKLEAKVALSAEYAKWQEKRLKFLAPAADQTRGRSEQVMSVHLKRYLDK